MASISDELPSMAHLSNRQKRVEAIVLERMKHLEFVVKYDEPKYAEEAAWDIKAAEDELVAVRTVPDSLFSDDHHPYWGACQCGVFGWSMIENPWSCDSCVNEKLYSHAMGTAPLEESCFLLSHDHYGKATKHVKVLGDDEVSEAIKEQFRKCSTAQQARVVLYMAEDRGLFDSIEVKYI